MTDAHTLDDTINKAAFWSAIVLILAGVLSVFFPLDSQAGPFAERMIWFSSNVGAFTMGWVVQMIAMLTLTGVFAGTAWQVRESHPVSAFVAGTALLISVVAFIIVKFIAIWSIPMKVYRWRRRGREREQSRSRMRTVAVVPTPTLQSTRRTAP